MRIKTNKKTILIVALVLLLVVQVLLGTMFMRNDYRRHKTSAVFDNYVNKNISSIFSEKKYAEETYSENSLVDPKLDFVDSSSNVYMIRGFVHKIEEKDDKYEIEVRRVDTDPQTMKISKNDPFVICFEDECKEDLKEISLLKEGSLTYIFQTKYSSGNVSNYIQVD